MTIGVDTSEAMVASVMTIYQAFGQGDVPTILERLADDVSWDETVRDTGLPYLRPRRGKAEVGQFFGDLAGNIELTQFDLGTPCVGPDQVIVTVTHSGRNIVTGKPIPETLECHVWTFGDDGLVSGFTHVFDYAIHERAAAL